MQKFSVKWYSNKILGAVYVRENALEKIQQARYFEDIMMLPSYGSETGILLL